MTTLGAILGGIVLAIAALFWGKKGLFGSHSESKFKLLLVEGFPVVYVPKTMNFDCASTYAQILKDLYTYMWAEITLIYTPGILQLGKRIPTHMAVDKIHFTSGKFLAKDKKTYKWSEGYPSAHAMLVGVPFVENDPAQLDRRLYSEVKWWWGEEIHSMFRYQLGIYTSKDILAEEGRKVSALCRTLRDHQR